MRKLRVHNAEMIPENWRDLLLVLWREDDAMVPDKERSHAAFKRITGMKPSDHIHDADDGDYFYHFYRPGWVLGIGYDGGFVGVLVNLEK